MIPGRFGRNKKKISKNKANKLCWAFRKNFVQHIEGLAITTATPTIKAKYLHFFAVFFWALRIYYEIDAAESLLQQFGFQAAPRHCFILFSARIERLVEVCPLTKHLITKNVATCNKFHSAVAIASFGRRPGK